MKKAVKFALIALAVLVVVFVVAVFVANSRYQFLFAGPKVSYETLLTPAARVRAVIEPPLARSLVSKVLGAQAPPPWVLERVMPYEAALMVSPDSVTGRIDVTLFLNPQRLTPLVTTAIDDYGIPRKAPYVTWSSTSVDAPRRGVLSLDGYMQMDDATVEAVKAEWGVVSLPGLAPFEGGHLAELSIDNRDGSLYALVSTFANKGLLSLPLPLESLRKTLAPVSTLSVYSDLAGEDELAIHLVVECQPSAEPGQITGVSFAIAGIVGELTKAATARGAVLTGTKHTDGPTITGDYSLKNVSALARP